MREIHKRSLPAKLYFKIMGSPDWPLYRKIYSKVPPIALLSALTLGTMATKESYKIGDRRSPEAFRLAQSVRIAQIKSSGRAVNTAFLMLGAGVFGAYLLAIADRLAITQSDRVNTVSSNQDNSEED